MVVHVRGMLVVECECQWGGCKLWMQARHALCVMIGTFCRMEHMLLRLLRMLLATRLAKMNIVGVRTSRLMIPTVSASSDGSFHYPDASELRRVCEPTCL